VRGRGKPVCVQFPLFQRQKLHTNLVGMVSAGPGDSGR
jgi:hypothetical protein